MAKEEFRKLRILVLLDEDLIPPDSIDKLPPEEVAKVRTEFDVVSNLKRMGHELRIVGVYDDLVVIKKAIEEFKPHIAFNLMEEFSGSSTLMQNVVAYLELLRLPCTGCNPRGLMLAHDKALSKKILAFHRIHVPQFHVFPLNARIRRSQKLKFPLLVKSLIEEGSVGISQASVVYDEQKLVERIEFIHRTVKTHAIVEEYIDGREIYVGVLGNKRLRTLAPWELIIQKLPEGSLPIATLKVKWDLKYQQRVGVVTQAAKDLSPEMLMQIERQAKRIYRVLELSGYSRLDFRLKSDGTLYLLEANPNPNLAEAEDFAASAKHSKVSYPSLLNQILQNGMSYEYMDIR